MDHKTAARTKLFFFKKSLVKNSIKAFFSRRLILTCIFLIALLEQFVEYSLRDPKFSDITTALFLKRFIVPGIIVYSFLCVQALQKSLQNTLSQIRPYVLLRDEEFNFYFKRARHKYKAIKSSLFLLALIEMILFFKILNFKLPMSDGQNTLPDSFFISLLIISTYAVLGWILLVLVVSAMKFSKILSNLSKEQILINVFDTTNLLPFGKFSLIQSISIAGLVIILIAFLGRPRQFIEYLVVIFLSSGSFLALILPLLSIRAQILRKKQEVLEQLNKQFQLVQKQIMFQAELNREALEEIVEKQEKLSKIKQSVISSPNWPFINFAAIAKAVATAASPLIYLVLTRLVELYIVPVMTP